ncbi:MAG: PaaI family thioesterase [Candidatus Aminicenantes bacterium]
MAKLITKYSHCFVCGDKNECGLKIDFYFDEGKAKAEYIASPYLQGYKDILHGGIISTLLDEVMIKSILALEIMVVTTSMDIKFKNPVKIGEKIWLEGWIKEEKGRIITAEGKAVKQNHTLVAEAEGTYFKVKDSMKKFLEKSLETKLNS